MRFFEQGMDLNKAMISNITRTGYNANIPMLPNGQQNPYLINNGRGQFEDMSWVLG